jgi:hypothetical protein
MEIKKKDSRWSTSAFAKATAGQEGSTDWFTGTVRLIRS